MRRLTTESKTHTQLLDYICSYTLNSLDGIHGICYEVLIIIVKAKNDFLFKKQNVLSKERHHYCTTCARFVRKNRLEEGVDTTSFLHRTESEESSLRQISSPRKVYRSNKRSSRKENHINRLHLNSATKAFRVITKPPWQTK